MAWGKDETQGKGSALDAVLMVLAVLASFAYRADWSVIFDKVQP